MNFNKEINKTADILGMVPGQEIKIDFNGKRVSPNANCADCFEFLTIDTAVLKEGKSGKTTLRFHGSIQYTNRPDVANYMDGRLISREIVPWEISDNDLVEIINAIRPNYSVKL